ncbi:hypothetical protein AK812_SmicGene47542, partial [Symbiodinium microadriaticum]
VVNTYDLGKCTGPFDCPGPRWETWDPDQDNNFPHGQWVGKNLYPN